jgi:hypothetical protein
LVSENLSKACVAPLGHVAQSGSLSGQLRSKPERLIWHEWWPKTFGNFVISKSGNLRSRKANPAFALQITQLQITKLQILLAIQLDDQLLVYRQLDIFASRQRNHAAFVILAINLQPNRSRLMASEIPRGFENRNLAAALADLNLFAHGNFVGRNIDLLAIHLHVSVTDQLSRLAAGDTEAQPKDDVVETPFERFQQLRTRDTLRTDRVLEVIPELAFLGEVDALGFLFFAQLQTVTYDFGLLIFPVLSGSEIALLDRAFVAEALRAFEEELDAFPAT